jgi:hypothetical protein
MLTWAFHSHADEMVIPHCHHPAEKSPRVVMKGICHGTTQHEGVNGTPDRIRDCGDCVEVATICDRVFHCQDVVGSCWTHKTFSIGQLMSWMVICNYSQHSPRHQQQTFMFIQVRRCLERTNCLPKGNSASHVAMPL